jgi:hypothetical protein
MWDDEPLAVSLLPVALLPVNLLPVAFLAVSLPGPSTGTSGGDGGLADGGLADGLAAAEPLAASFSSPAWGRKTTPLEIAEEPGSGVRGAADVPDKIESISSNALAGSVSPGRTGGAGCMATDKSGRVSVESFGAPASGRLTRIIPPHFGQASN